jgi:hydrogenase nickel incorporation protein HypB
MCTTCGCGNPDEKATIKIPGKKYELDLEHMQHDNKQNHHHHLPHKITIEQDILLENNLLAERNRGFFEAKNAFVLNLMSSPGSGKTCLLEKTILELKDKIDFYVIEGDQQTMNDAERIKATGAPVVQVNTGNGCHLDSEMIHRAVRKLDIKEKSLIMIENVGNLVCPSLFDLGENCRVVIMSVTEGEDKPIKYPTMFQSADVCIFTKLDLLPYLDYDIEKAKKYALQVNHHLTFFELSSKSGDGMHDWFHWLIEKRSSK